MLELLNRKALREDTENVTNFLRRKIKSKVARLEERERMEKRQSDRGPGTFV